MSDDKGFYHLMAAIAHDDYELFKEYDKGTMTKSQFHEIFKGDRFSAIKWLCETETPKVASRQAARKEQKSAFFIAVSEERRKKLKTCEQPKED